MGQGPVRIWAIRLASYAPESRLIFQVICKHPERRSYVQRVCFLGQDVSLRINDESRLLV